MATNKAAKKTANQQKRTKPPSASKRHGRVEDSYSVLVEQRVRFITKDPVSVDAVIASLRGMERIVQTQLPRAIKSATGARVKSAEVLVTGLDDGSFIEDLTIKLLFKSKKDYEKFMNKLADTIKTGWDAGTPMLKVGIGVLIGALVLNGLGLLPRSPSQTGALSNVQGDNNAIIIIGAETYQTSPAEFQQAIESAVQKSSKKRSAQSALDATAPAREQGAAIEIEMGGGGQAMPIISESTAASLPSNVSVPDVSEDVAHKKVKVNFRASDSDSPVKGWAGTIPRLVDQRTRIIFANPADRTNAAFKPDVTADVTVTYSNSLHDKALLIVIDKVH